MSQPYLSVVITGRNDDYGVDFVGRLNTFIRHLDYQVRDKPGFAELVLVEWNPLPDRAPLKDVIPATVMPVRIVTVPADVHDAIGAANPVLEFFGKNVGIRHSTGEFVLVTNPDILFSTSLMNMLKFRNLRRDCLYRVDRYDFHSEGIQELEPAAMVDFALSRTFVAHTAYRSVSVAANSSWATLPTTDGDPPHTNACGDFILAARDAFFQAGGLHEMPNQKWHVDSYSLYRLLDTGLIPMVWKSPACIFHQHHERKGADVAYSLTTAQQMGRTRGEPNWGLGDRELPTWCSQ